MKKLYIGMVLVPPPKYRRTFYLKSGKPQSLFAPGARRIRRGIEDGKRQMVRREVGLDAAMLFDCLSKTVQGLVKDRGQDAG